MDNPTPGPLGYTVDVTACCNDGCVPQEITGKDFGNVQLATKSGIKWNDVNGNHVRDLPGDVGLNGWVIHLFGTAANGTAVHQTATTANDGVNDGAYKFTVLPGTYKVCEVLQPTWTQTFPTLGFDCDGPPNPDPDNLTPGPIGYAIVLTEGQTETGNNFGNTTVVKGSKSGIKWNDVNGNGVRDLPGDVGLNGWEIHLFGTETAGGAAVHKIQTTHTATAADVTCPLGALGCYYFGDLNPGTYHVCERLKPGSTQTFPTSGFDCDGPPNPDADNPTPGPLGYEFTITTAGENHTGNDFGNTTINCPEDPTAVLTKTVIPSQAEAGINYKTVQAAYAAAANTGETIGMFGNTVENVVLDGTKTLKITQCTSARITAANNSLPVWSVTSTGKLLIQGPDSVGGQTGWLVGGNGGHTLKSVRANGASLAGIAILSNNNTVSWNDVSGNAAGIVVNGNSNTLKGGTVGPNTGDGVQLNGNNNSLSGATLDSNTGSGVVAFGSNNQVKSNKANSNGHDGFWNFGGAGNNYSGNSSNTGGKPNGLHQYEFTTAGVNGGSNRADGVNVPKTSAPTKCADFAQAGTVCD